GAFDVVGETRNQTTYDILFNGKRSLLSDLNLSVSAGGSIWKRDYNSGHNDVSQLVIPGVYTMENSAGQPDATVYLSRKQVNSLYASASFNYKNWFNVDVTGRNDWSSTLPKNHYSYFYPSVGAAFIFTDALGLQNNVLTYGKLRASWTRVGNDTDPYNLQAVYGAGTPWAGSPTFNAPNTLPNATLKPEQTTGEEGGTDLGFLNNRLILNVTWYQKKPRHRARSERHTGADGKFPLELRRELVQEQQQGAVALPGRRPRRRRQLLARRCDGGRRSSLRHAGRPEVGA
ncbi:MAG: hypothetical protein P8099_10115, partial [Gemmatimonadota bacterium]